MAADPIRTLVVPRVLACIIMTPVLTIFSDSIGILGGWLIAVGTEGVRNYPFWHYAQVGMDMFTVYVGKSRCPRLDACAVTFRITILLILPTLCGFWPG